MRGHCLFMNPLPPRDMGICFEKQDWNGRKGRATFQDRVASKEGVRDV